MPEKTNIHNFISLTRQVVERFQWKSIQYQQRFLVSILDYKKLYFFSRAREDPANPLSQPCFARNCTGTFFQEPALCPQGYVQSRFGSTCANCSAPFGVYGRRCKCQDWMSCAHRIYLKLSCSASRPFMQIKVRECVKGKLTVP